MNKFKAMTKFERTGCQKDRSHTPHWVVITKKGIVSPYFQNWTSKKDVSDWANKNLNEYYEIHKDWFVE